MKMFACLTRAHPWDESDSPCEPYSAPKLTNNDWSMPNGLPSTPPGLPSMPQSSWQLCSNTNTTQNPSVFRRHVLGPPDEPATLKPAVPEIVHPIQHGITPKRLLLPHSDTEILTRIDDDISSIRDGYTAWVMSDATTMRERHLACKGGEVRAFRKAHERRNPSHQPKYRFDTSVPNRLLEQTRISILSWNPGTQTWQTRVPLRNTPQVHGTLKHYKKRSSISSSAS